MKAALMVLSVFVGAGLLVAGGEDPILKERKQMAGSWRVLTHEKDGKKTPDDKLGKAKHVINFDGKIIVEVDGKTVGLGTIKLDPAKKPKQADVAYTEGEFKGQTVLGIYEIEGENMKACYAPQGKARPTEFASKPGSGNILITYKQEDPPKLFANSIGMKFQWIYPGTFAMGSNDKEEGRGPTEVLHKVTLTKGYFMGVHTVTQEQWEAVMGSNPSHFKGEKNLPVEEVSWLDCQEFLKKLRDKDKKPYRLPTEAEWEYACRAGSATPFHFGETLLPEQANYNADEIYGKGKKGTPRGTTAPVGSFPANNWGLYDMHGNVWEWCQDWYGDYPKDVVDPQGPDKGEVRVVRGGSRFNSPAYCRSAQRHFFLPGYRSSYVGVRVCFSE